MLTGAPRGFEPRCNRHSGVTATVTAGVTANVRAFCHVTVGAGGCERPAFRSRVRIQPQHRLS